MSKKTDIINLAAEFASEGLEVSLNAEAASGFIAFDESSMGIVDLSYNEGEFPTLKTHDWSSPFVAMWKIQHFGDSGEEWSKAKIMFRDAVFEYLKNRKEQQS